MAHRVMGLVLIYTLLVLLAPTDADGAFFQGRSLAAVAFGSIGR
jgi:hypothetical protein